MGLGIINAGRQNDEDWLAAPVGALVPYSNTLSSTNNGKLGYATFDIGYDVLRGAGTKVGPFVGYNYFAESWETFGCTQIANQFSDSEVTGWSKWKRVRVEMSLAWLKLKCPDRALNR